VLSDRSDSFKDLFPGERPEPVQRISVSLQRIVVFQLLIACKVVGLRLSFLLCQLAGVVPMVPFCCAGIP
jgi:hypothetical protein